MNYKVFTIVFVFLIGTNYVDCLANDPAIINLQCEHLPNPMGIDAPHPRLSWQLQDNTMGALQKAYKIIVGTDSLQVTNNEGNNWNTGKITSDQMLISYAGKPIMPFTRYYWKVQVWNHYGKAISSTVNSFETAFMQNTPWKGTWIADDHDKDYKPAPYFRKTFETNKKIKSARAYIAVGGLYELYINGNKMGDRRLDPMYTRFDRRILYTTYDVTSQLQQGSNAVGVILGNGWYNHQPTAVWYFHFAPWRARPTFCMDLRITYEDGSVETVSSGRDWKTATGPIVFNSIYTGEQYDARLELPGWNTIGFDDSKWQNALPRSAPASHIVAQVLYPIRDVERIPAKNITRLNDSTYVFDLGRNIAGVSEFTVNGTQGTIFRLKHGEKLYPNGRVDMSNIDMFYRPTAGQDSFQTDVYILNGKGEETFRPRFNYKGFQYVEVRCNKPVVLTKENLTGYFMHSDVPQTGKLQSSNTMVNKLWQATNNSYLSNLFGYPTDCPQREKNGWTGDAHIASETGLFNFDGITIYEKWLADHRDEQQPNGVLPATIPSAGWGYEWGNGPDWTSTIAIIPWNVYLFYGDSKLLSDCYDNIKRYVDHITDISPLGLTTWGLGDWVPVKSQSPVEFTSSAYYFTDVSILANAARLFGKTEDYKTYTALALKIKDAFNAKYLDKNTGIYGKGSQTELSVPLFWGLVPDPLKPTVAANLANRVKEDSLHIDVGLLGTKAILSALSDNGYADIAYAVATQETYPSWGWWIVNGATTLYENWNIQAKNESSLNHIMFGEIGAWMYKALGGLHPDPANPGFKNSILKPGFPKDLNAFACEHQSPYGHIVSRWERQQGVIHYTVTVPANATATLLLPASYTVKSTTSLVTAKRSEPYNSVMLHSGTYSFTITPQ